MKVFQNIPGITKVLSSLPELGRLKREIDSARAVGDNERERAAILEATSTWGNRLMKSFHIDLSVYGKENIPKEGNGPLVYVSNHQGFADIPTMCAVLTNVQFGFIAKDGLKKIPLYGTWMQRIRSVMIQREDSRASLKAISTGIQYIEDGFSMLVFPEGTRARGGDMNPFKKGALKLATKPGVPIVPISINGTYEVLEKQGYLRSAPIDIMIHPAIETKGLSRQEEKELHQQVFDIVQSGLLELKAMRK